MDVVQVAQRYFDAWNHHDVAAIVAAFTEGGTYSDPVAGQGLTGAALTTYAKDMWGAFPDLSFETVTLAAAGKDMVAVQWLMQGTNIGSFKALPPTNRSIAVRGADFIWIEGDKISAVQGYFDSRAVPEQLGLQVVVQPHTVNPFAFGTCSSVQTGKRNKPEAFSITALRARSEDEIQKIRDLGREIAAEMPRIPGFIGWVGMTIGSCMMTVTAWETPEAPQQMLRGGTHENAVRRFFGPELAAGGWTSVWIPARINALWVRCTGCQRMVDSSTADRTCQCGASLPEPMPYW